MMSNLASFGVHKCGMVLGAIAWLNDNAPCYCALIGARQNYKNRYFGNRELHNPNYKRPGYAWGVSGAIFGDWLRAKNVSG